nr:uncharacterized protein LOC112024737 [Quercus suber]
MEANPTRHSEQGPRLKKQQIEDKKDRDKKAGPSARSQQYTPLNTLLEQVLMQIKDDPSLKWLEKIKEDPNKRNRNKCCHFHRDHGHDTDECFDLKQQIENLIRVITGGSATGQLSKSKKAYLKVVQSVQLSGWSPIARATDEQAITFTEEDTERIHHPHDDAIVITLLIADYTTKKVLVDNGSSVDKLYFLAFQQMRLGRDRLRPQITKDVSFLVVDYSSSYNAIIGKPTLNSWKAVTSTYHLSVKFPTDYGIGQVQGDQLAARECYLDMLATD